jgi:hypothetical protein
MSNANSIKNKAQEVKIGDQTYKIRFTLNSFIELEDMYGSLDNAFEAFKGEVVKDKETGLPVMIADPDDASKKVEKVNISFKVIRNILYAGLIADQEITKEEVGNLLTPGNMEEILPKVNKALLNSLPEKVNEQDDELKN